MLPTLHQPIPNPGLQTLGGLSFQGYSRVSPLLLLTYLAVQGPVTRRQLERCFWPAAQDPANSLRVVLHSLRKKFPDAVQGTGTLSTAVNIDVQALLAASGEAALLHPPDAFLNTVDLQSCSQEFQSWANRIRQQIAVKQRQELLKLAAQADVRHVQSLCERAWALPGQATTEELQQFLHFTDPESALHQQIRYTLEQQGHLRPTLNHHTALIGRQEVLNVLTYWGLQTGGGVAIISGLGGMGKSTVARETVRLLGRLGRSPVQGDAEGTTSAADLLSRLGSQIAPRHPVDRWGALRPHLGLNPVVLLDGMDGLSDLDAFLQTVRVELPDVRWLLTTRAQPETALTGVQFVRLTGLSVPDEQAGLAETEQSPAVQFFLRAAAAQGVKLRLTSEQANLLKQLTRAVQGHPLALTQLARALCERDLLSISAELSPWKTLKEVLGQVAALTWNLLPEADQERLVTLYAFSDFSVPDLQEFGVSLDDLRVLDRHALLDDVSSNNATPRYRLHPVFKDFLELQEHPQLAQAVTRHTRHFLAWAGQQEYPAPALGRDLANVLSAISHGLHEQELTPKAIMRVAQNHDVRGLHTTGLAWLSELNARASTEFAPAPVRAEIQAWQAWFQMREGQYAKVVADLQTFMESPLRDYPLARAQFLLAGAFSLGVSGVMKPALNLARQAIAASNEAEDRVNTANASANLLWLLMHGQQFNEARLVCKALSAQVDALPETLRIRVQQQLLFARLYLSHDARPELQEEAGQLAQTAHLHGNHIACASLRITEAVACWQMHDWEKLAELSQTLISYTRTHPLAVHEMIGWYLLGSAHREQNQLSAAREAVRTGLQLALKHSYVQEILHGVLQGGLLVERTPEGHALLERVACDPRLTQWARAVARKAGVNFKVGAVMEQFGEAATAMLRALES